MARPPLIDDSATVSRVLRAIRRGNSKVDACARARCSYAWFRKAMLLGLAADPDDSDATTRRYAKFVEDVKRAECHAVDVHVTQLGRNAKQGDTVASIFMLKSLRPKRFNRTAKQQLEVTAGAAPTEGLPLPKRMPGETVRALLGQFLEHADDAERASIQATLDAIGSAP